MRRLLTIGIALSLIAAACGDDDGAVTTPAPSSTTTADPSTTATTAATTTAPSGFIAASDDGRATLEVPPGALDDDPGIAISAVDPADHPDDVAALDVVPWVYDLAPSGLAFDEPARLTVEIPYAEFAAEGFDDATPLVTMLVTGTDGGWEAAADQVIRRDGDTVMVSGSIDHFSGAAVVPEQVFIETRLVEITTDPANRFGLDFTWSNGAPLSPPGTGSIGFRPEGTGAEALPGTLQDGLISVGCPPTVSSILGTLGVEVLLPGVDGTTGETGVVSAPRLIGTDTTVRPTIQFGLQLSCRPMISADGMVRIDLFVDHPDGDVIIPNEDFRGGLSAMLLVLAAVFPGLYAGLIRDVDGDGRIGPDDLMYPPVATTVDGDTTTAVLPLFGYGDYFPYFTTIEPRELQTEVTVRDGATILLGGLTREETAVPMLGDLPFIGRVFGDESTQSENTELVILLTPQIVEDAEE